MPVSKLVLQLSCTFVAHHPFNKLSFAAVKQNLFLLPAIKCPWLLLSTSPHCSPVSPAPSQCLAQRGHQQLLHGCLWAISFPHASCSWHSCLTPQWGQLSHLVKLSSLPPCPLSTTVRTGPPPQRALPPQRQELLSFWVSPARANAFQSFCLAVYPVPQILLPLHLI